MSQEFCIVFTWTPGAPKFREVALAFGEGDAEQWALDLEPDFANFEVRAIFYAGAGETFIDGTCSLEVVH